MLKNLFLISTDAEDLIFAQEAGKVAGLNVRQIDLLKNNISLLEAEESFMLMVSIHAESEYQAFEQTVQNSIGLFSQKMNPNTIHFLCSQKLHESQYFIQSPLFGNFILKQFTDPKENGHRYGLNLKASLNENDFTLSQVLKPNTKIQMIRLNATTEKLDAIDAIKSYLLTAKFPSRIATTIANAVDELILNAIFDAPIDELGRSLLNTVLRSSSFPLDGRKAVEIHLGFDGDYVAISVIDLFGSVDRIKLFTPMAKSYMHEPYKLKTNTANSGTGLSSILHSGGSLFFMSEASVQTEVVVFFKRTDCFSEFKKQFRFVSTQLFY